MNYWTDIANNVITPLADILSFIVLIPAIFIFWRSCRDIFSRHLRMVVAGILALLLFNNFSNSLQWLGITDALDVYEDYSGLLLPVFCFFVLFVFVQERGIEELRESERNFRLFAESLIDIMVVASPAGRILFTNQAARDKLGYSDEELVEMNLLDWHREEDREEAEQIFGTILNGECGHCPLSLIAKDGTVIPVETSVSLGKWNGADCVFGICKDLTAEQEAQQRFERIFRDNPSPMTLAVLPERRIVDINDAALAALGYSRDEIIGKTAAELGLFADPDVQETVSEQIRTEGRVSATEIQVQCKDGSLRDGIFSGEVISSQTHDYFLSVTIDITKRKRVEKALQHRMAFEGLIADICSRFAQTRTEDMDAVIDRALADIGIFAHADRAYLFQFRESGARMDKTHEWCAEGIEPQITRLQDISLDDRLPWFAEHIRKGETVHVPRVSDIPTEAESDRQYFDNRGVQSFITVPIKISGHLTGFFGFDAVKTTRGWSKDDQLLLEFLGETLGGVLARKRAEEERQSLEAQILHAQKLESLGVLAGGIAHDFNNLLTGILGNADLALMELSPVSPARQNLQEIETAARRSADLCRQMLAYSGKGKFIVETLDINELIDEMSHLLDTSVSKKAILRYNLADNLPAISADATQIRQIIMNLIINASEAIGKKSGVISVSTGAMDCDRTYFDSTFLGENLHEGVYVYFEVSDTGCGMDEATRDKIFDPFFTTKFTGRGLGLAAVLGIVRGHGGTIKVYSEQGRGTTFKVLLPAVESSTTSRVVPQDNLVGWHGSGTVLLADDEETVRVVGSMMLERAGFDVVTADDGRDAVEKFKQLRDQLAFVLLDLTMPHMDGEESFRELRQIDDSVPVILSSGYNEQDVVERFAGKGLAGFIQKPYEYDELVHVLRNVLK